jgi:S1-C subfamily serine protease
LNIVVAQQRGRTPMAGLVVANLSPAVADEVGLSADATGVVALEVNTGPARQFFRKGDVITEVNGQKIVDVEGLRNVLSQATGRWNIGLIRGGRKAFIRLG